MKLNLGCGTHKVDGYINVDMFPECEPDVVCNLEQTPWPWETSSVTAVRFHHSLEHMGADVKVFFSMMKELYRVSAHHCVIEINVPHPRHDDFMNDPTHVRPITPGILSLFNKSDNLAWKAANYPNTPLGLYLGVDFRMNEITYTVDEPYLTLRNENKISELDLNQMIKEKNNVVREIRVVMSAIK